VQNAIPPNLTASNNSPAEIGSPVSLTIGAVVSATSYAWAGPNGFTSSSRAHTIAALADTHIGTYTVTINIAGGCSFTSTTAITLANCDIFI